MYFCFDRMKAWLRGRQEAIDFLLSVDCNLAQSTQYKTLWHEQCYDRNTALAASFVVFLLLHVSMNDYTNIQNDDSHT